MDASLLRRLLGSWEVGHVSTRHRGRGRNRTNRGCGRNGGHINRNGGYLSRNRSGSRSRHRSGLGNCLG